MTERQNVNRISNCIKALARNNVLLYDTSINYAFEISQQYEIKEILYPKISTEISEKTEIKLALDNN